MPHQCSRLTANANFVTFLQREIDADKEWSEWNQLGDPVLHIDLRNWADLLLIAPLSAHTLAKIAHGFSDDTLSCVARAWEFGNGIAASRVKPVVLAPAMNTAMWEHVLTGQQIETIRNFFPSRNSEYFRVVDPQAKLLACGDFGDGALAEVYDIVSCVYDVCELLDSPLRKEDAPC
jgi:phosphopantothenoylcysteine decarboxylase